MTTEAGLVRYDGVSTSVYNLKDLPSLKTIRIFTLFHTLKNGVIGCNRIGEIFAIKNNEPINETISERVHIYDFSYQNGNARSIKDLNFEINISQKFADSSAPITNSLWLNDSVWIAVSKNFTYIFNNKKLVHQWQQKNENPYLIAEDNFVYVLNNNAEGYCINLINTTLINATTTDTALTKGKHILFYDKLNNQPLILNRNNLYKLNFKNNFLYTNYVATLNNLPTYITSVLLHKDGKTIFISTNSSGLYIYHFSPFRIYKTTGDDILNNNSACLLIDSNRLFTCRSIIFNLTTGKSNQISIPINHTQSLAMDTFHNIWSAITGNIISFKISNLSNIKKYAVANDNYLQTCYLTKNGRFWISTFKFLGCPENNQLKQIISYGNKPDSVSFNFLTETPNGQLVGVNTKGIFFIDADSKKFIPIVKNNKLSQIRNVFIDSNYFFWISTYGNGIFLYDEKAGKLVSLPVDDKGYLLFSHACIDDSNGNFLVPTNKGLFKLNKKNLLQIYAQPSTPLLYQYFDVSSGLLTNEFNGGGEPAFNRLSNGDIILPALQGLVRVKINELFSPTYYPLFIDYVEAGKNIYKPDSEIHFKKDERLQTWHISFAQWNAPNAQSVFYRLDEDSAWHRLKPDERKIQLSDLSGGTHSLQIKYQYGFLPNQFSAIKFKFYVEKKYYETIWFWFLVVALLATIILFIIRFRTFQLKQKNIQLQKIIQKNTQQLSDKNAELEETLRDLNEALNILNENSVFKNRLIGLLGHDMLMPLRFIANISNHLYTSENLTKESAKETSAEIKNTATELMFLGESLIQWIKLQEGNFRLILQHINLKQLVEEIILIDKNITNVKNNTIICEAASGLSCIYDAMFLKVILHNLLLNANKFTSHGTITINANISDGLLTISIKDTGTGMNSKIVNSLNKLIPVSSQKGTDKETGWGMGYILIIDLLHFVNGKLYVKSEMGAGTVVSFSVPL